MMPELALLQVLPPPEMPPIEMLLFVQSIVKSVLTTIAVIVVGFPLARALGKRINRGAESPTLPADVGGRLERIEQAVDAMAIEIERISEGQRYVTKLLADRSGAPAARLGGVVSPQGEVTSGS